MQNSKHLQFCDLIDERLFARLCRATTRLALLLFVLLFTFGTFKGRKELLKTPKAWICNMGATVIGEPFQAWVGERIKERNETVTKERSMLIQMDPHVAAAFHGSSAVSRKLPI